MHQKPDAQSALHPNHGRPRIHIGGYIGYGGEVTILVDEPSLASRCEAVDNRLLIELGRQYEQMLESHQIRADCPHSGRRR
jgi:hypothetical protein